MESKITIKGQTTVPAPIRAALQMRPGTRLVWHLLPDGAILVRPKTLSILDLAGSMQAPEGRHVSLEDMNPWR